MTSAWPDFIIIGAPKAGSTALHAALAQHPGIAMSAIKEPKYFMCDGPAPRGKGPGDAHSSKEWIWETGRYQAFFEDAPAGSLRGESTPFYLSDFDSQIRIRRTIPEVKLIAVLRDPIDRAYSNWTHLWCDGLEPEADFLRACDLEDSRVAAGWAPFWRYFGLGRYGEQLEHLYSLFDRSQVFWLRYRDLVQTPVETLDAITTFLGVESGLIRQAPAENVSHWVENTPTNNALQGLMRSGAALGQYFPPRAWRVASVPVLSLLHRGDKQRPALEISKREQLLSRIVDDVELLERVTGESFADWTSAKVTQSFSVRRSWEPSAQATS